MAANATGAKEAAAKEAPAKQTTAISAEAVKTGPGAQWPKGQYADLNRLPDWGGVWVLNWSRPVAGASTPEQPQFKGEYLERYLSWQREIRENNGMARRQTSNCMPPGMPGMMGTGQYPIEFLFTPGRVSLHHEAWMQWRSIFTDGRGHPEDLEPGIFGHSIGHWESEVLVVETIGIKPITELGPGMKHSAALKVMERIFIDPKQPDTLVVEMAMDDPEALTATYHRRLTFHRERDWNLMEFVCAENDRNPVGADGYTTFK
jgi:hypothetical protein